jgi:HPt (histidine-containing phosphotransfer) domain-containing protein
MTTDNQVAQGELRILDVARLHTLGDETGLGVRGVAALFLEQMAEQLVELRSAIHDRAPTTLSQTAHRCAGSSVMAGMERLSRLLRELEHSPVAGLSDAAGCEASVHREFAAVMTELSVVLATSQGEGPVAA